MMKKIQNSKPISWFANALIPLFSRLPVLWIGLLFIIASIPLLYAAVEPSVWSVYAVLIFILFIYGVWTEKVDSNFKKSPLLIFSLGLFFVYTLFQSLPIPAGTVSFLNPFQHHVLEQSSFLLNESSSWYSISYIYSASLARWIFLLSLFFFFWMLCKYLTQTENLVTLVGVISRSSFDPVPVRAFTGNDTDQYALFCGVDGNRD